MKKMLAVLLIFCILLCGGIISATAEEQDMILNLPREYDNPLGMNLSFTPLPYFSEVQADAPIQSKINTDPGEEKTTVVLANHTGAVDQLHLQMRINRFTNYTCMLHSEFNLTYWGVQGFISGDNLKITMKIGGVTLVDAQPLNKSNIQTQIFEIPLRQIPDFSDDMEVIITGNNIIASDLLFTLPMYAGIPTGNYFEDVNIDHEINNKDYSALKKILNESYTDSYLNADINDDGYVNNKDLARLKKILADWFV